VTALLGLELGHKLLEVGGLAQAAKARIALGVLVKGRSMLASPAAWRWSCNDVRSDWRASGGCIRAGSLPCRTSLPRCRAKLHPNIQAFLHSWKLVHLLRRCQEQECVRVGLSVSHEPVHQAEGLSFCWSGPSWSKFSRRPGVFGVAATRFQLGTSATIVVLGDGRVAAGGGWLPGTGSCVDSRASPSTCALFGSSFSEVRGPSFARRPPPMPMRSLM